MTDRFIIPAGLDPARSLFGRWLVHRSDDRLQGEARYYVHVVGVFTALLIAGFAAWGLVPHRSGYWIAQAFVLAAFVLTCIAGFRPATMVDVGADAVLIRRRRTSSRIDAGHVRRVSLLDAQAYHRHHRLYAATRAYIGPVHDQVVLIETADGPVVLGIVPAEQPRFLERVQALIASRSTSVRVA